MVIEATSIIIVGLAACYFLKQKKVDYKVSIKESMDLTNLPIITLYDGDIKLNFLLDSGSNYSYISKESSKALLGTPIDIEGFNYLTCNGSDSVSKKIDSVLKYKDLEFKTELMINESLDSTFADVKNQNGVQLHGILGSDFLSKNKYVLDFANLVVYPKKN